jgi:MFS family permease
VLNFAIPMQATERGSNKQGLYLYFSLLALMMNVTNPQWVLDIPTSYMLKNLLQASASQVALFRLLTGIPFYVGFIFGLVRDLWNPFGWRDPGYFRVFVPLTMLALAWGAFARTTYTDLLVAMIFGIVSYSFLAAAFQGLLALIAQEAMMPGRLSTLLNVFLNVAIIIDYFASGWMAAHLSHRQVFLLVLALTAPLAVFGFWKPRSVFDHVYQDSRAKGAGLLGDIQRLVRHRAIYPVILITCSGFLLRGPAPPCSIS